MVQTALRSLTCRSCRSSIIQLFAATFFDTPLHTRSQPQRFLPVARPFSHGRPRLADDRAKATLSSDSTPNDPPTSLYKPDPAADALPSSAQSSLPWYLQVSTPTPPPSTSTHLTSPRDLLPDLPPKPPLILSPILSHLSVDLGLDSLTLLDLRSLTNPPPALGANLLMIIGTARSIKHLNVSADRLCRWLRSEYRLRPYADGLLGRQELKVKLRRRERRRKLKASVGNMMGGMDERAEGDDGVTTGWICVNVGQVDDNICVGQAGGPDEAAARTVQDVKEEEEEEEEYTNPTTSSEAAEEEQQDQDANPTYIGFGSRSNLPRIVVQMFTEEKRAELDLEGLWQDRATRRIRKAEKNDEEAEAGVQEKEQSTNDESGFASMTEGGQASSSDFSSGRAVAGG